MRTSSEEIREALEAYRLAARESASASSGSYMSEALFESVPDDADETTRNNLAQQVVTATVIDIECQFDLMIATKTLDTLIELAKVEAANDRLRSRAR